MRATINQRVRKVVVTGAAGNIGRKIVESLQGRRDLALTLLDRRKDAAGRIAACDLRQLDHTWTHAFAGADTVIHLAANPNHRAEWPDLIQDNVDATLNVFHAAVDSGVAKVVLASSLHAGMGTRRQVGTPDTPYGISKAVAERIGRHYAEAHGLSVICLRLGMVREGANHAPRGHPDVAVQQRWLSNRDLCRAVSLAVDADRVGFAVVNVRSAVEGSPWSLADARQLLGFEPLDRYVPVQESPAERARRLLRRLAKRTVRTLRLTSGLHFRDSD